MPKIRVDASEAFCQKKGCKGPGFHRHHRGHEFLFVHRWVGTKEKQKAAFIRRYWKFLERDIVRICPEHHAEVHLDLDVEILNHFREAKKGIDHFTYKDAMVLVKKLRKYTDQWLERETPGVDPKLVFGSKSRFSRAKRRRIATRRYHDERKKDARG